MHDPTARLQDQLAIFDIDGTLTATNRVDDECYIRAAAETLDLDHDIVDWSDAPHISDSGIARYLWSRHRGCNPEPRELVDLQERFVAILRDELMRAPERFAAIDGATAIFSHLRSAGWCLALATGGWSASAAIKLRAAGVLATHLPMACADDAESREDIVRLAWQKAEGATGATFKRVVSVGDAAWDVRTARSLGLPFVGIATGDAANRLRREGATTILADLADQSAVLEALRTATTPVNEALCSA